jgi:hypothetical protein
MQAGLESLRIIPQGYAGTRETILRMKDKVDQGKKDSRIISLASDIASSVRERDHWGENEAIFNWVKRNIRYVNDPYGVELIQSPIYTVQRRAGDCDDLSIMVNALSASLGYNTAFKTIKADKRYPNEFSHVYSLIEIDGKWITADASQKTKPLGWEPPSHLGYEIWGYSSGKVKSRSMPPKMKGSQMLGNYSLGQLGQVFDLKSAVIAWLNRGKAKPGQITSKSELPAQRVNNAYIDRPFDPESKSYYGDWGGDGSGKYNTGLKEEVYETGSAIGVLYPLPKIKPPSYHDREGRNLNIKFAGRERYVPYPPDLNAITHGTPEIR